MSNATTNSLLATDIDGTLTHPNTPPTPEMRRFCQRLQALDAVELVPVSGKPCDYVWRFAEEIGCAAVLGENCGAYQLRAEIGEPPCVFAPERGAEDLLRLRELIGLGPTDEGVVRVTLGGDRGQVAVEEGKVSVLTLFCEYTDPGVKSRWQFEPRWSRVEAYQALWELIREHGLGLFVLEPHGDGAVDVVREREQGAPLDKSVLPEALESALGVATTGGNVAMLGDGSNDVPAMILPGVVGVTFSNCDRQKVIEPVLAQGGADGQSPGIVTERPAPDGGGPAEGILRLAAEQDFFGDQGQAVVSLVTDLYPDVADSLCGVPRRNRP